MKQCPFCYVKNPDDARYCRHCGKATYSVLNDVERPKTIVKKEPKPVGKKILLTIVYLIIGVLYYTFLFPSIIEWNLPDWLSGLFIIFPVGLVLSPWMSD